MSCEWFYLITSCSVQVARYTCPNCRHPYCSLRCYKSDVFYNHPIHLYQAHAECTETFYKSCFMDELKHSQVADDEKARMRAMLNQFEKDQQELHLSGLLDDAEEEYDQRMELLERLAGIDLGACSFLSFYAIDSASAEMILAKLTPQEIQAFEAQLQSPSSLLPIYTPCTCRF